MSPKSSLQRLIVKGAHENLPEHGRPSGVKPNPLWEAVASETKDSPGLWVAFGIPGKTAKQLGSVRQQIKSGKYSAFKQGKWDAAVRGDVLYVKYLGEASADVVDFKSREVA